MAKAKKFKSKKRAVVKTQSKKEELTKVTKKKTTSTKVSSPKTEIKPKQQAKPKPKTQTKPKPKTTKKKTEPIKKVTKKKVEPIKKKPIPKKKVKEEEIVKEKISSMEIIVISLLGVLLLVLTAGLGTFFYLANPIRNYKEYDLIEDKMKEIVTLYYEEEMKENTYSMNRQKISLKLLTDKGYDVSDIKDPKTEESCKPNSYSLIEFDQEEQVLISIDNYLVCGDYITKHK